jgi:tetratricopeptide (TPR) repeat protein
MRRLWAVFGTGVAALFCAALAAAPSETPADPKVQAALSRGVSLYQKGDLFAAREEFRGALRIDPRQPKALSYMDKIERRLKAKARDLLKAARMNRAQADRDVRRALSGVPDDAEAARLLHKALEEEAGDPAAARDLEWLLSRPAAAAPAVEPRLERRLEDRKTRKTERSVKEKTAQVDALYRKAASLYAKGRHDEAAELLQEVLSIHPLHLDAQRYLEKIESIKGTAEDRP